jgi:hypothetical protein
MSYLEERHTKMLIEKVLQLESFDEIREGGKDNKSRKL